MGLVERDTRDASEPIGLTSAEAARRLSQFGTNSVTEKTPPRWLTFLAKFWSPIPWLLEAAMILEVARGRHVEATAIALLLLFNATLAFVQEGRAGSALAALKKRLAPTALALRDGKWTRLPAADLVPGDVVSLALGALVPADARIASGSALADQSMLTGESIPVEVSAGGTVYAGSLVRRGQAVAEVTATGVKSYFGRTAELVRVARAESTEQAAVFGVTRNLALINGAVALLIIAGGYAIALPTSELIRLALTALLATIPVALPATFTLSAAFAAQALAGRGVLLTRLSASHEAAAMDVLCADKTGTLTRNEIAVAEVVALSGFGRDEVLALAARASATADQDPIDSAIRTAASQANADGLGRLVRFVPFDPATKMSEAVIAGGDGSERRVVKGAFERVSCIAECPEAARQMVDTLAGEGHRVISVAVGAADSLRLAGVIALSDPPRDEAKPLIDELRRMGVRTVMVTGDSAATGAAVARAVGIGGRVCPADQLTDDVSTHDIGVFARVVPEQKYKLVKVLQGHGHVVGMCGDGTNDAPALRQAQIGIAVATATDVAKAAAGMVLTEPGLSGIVYAVREGRIGFQRLLTYTFNMLVKKIEIVLFLAAGLALTGNAVMTPALMVFLFLTNDFLSMSLTTDRATPAPSPSVWRMGDITRAAIVLGACKLAFSISVLALGRFRLGLGTTELQTLAFAALAFGNQAALYVLRERRCLWSSKPGNWVLASSAVDLAVVCVLVLTGTLMRPLPWQLLAGLFAAATGFALLLDRIKLLVTAVIRVE
ncbi:MAG TPA: HAD-IC family P-type ATPase [Bradyrhizobium sp.]|uniref:HAD-IC family P-type ATPase n=1 Tax=Bradyrhizobium sp. TaxID=376 RepID=UPI002CB668E9|nr:HAD-IC family P-type ATPase [Bradyrhizobium sp.]HLZ01156.1 HAD-IC family P-type ATPase [Bradyrhizobium sp.]